MEHVTSSALTFPSAPATARREYNHDYPDEDQYHAVAIYEIANVVVQDVPAVAWNDSNRLYLLFEYNHNINNKSIPVNHPILFKTTTVEQRNSNQVISWNGTIVKLPNQNGQESLKIYVYHECLAIQDKLVGLCEIKLSALCQERMSSYSTDLYDSTSIVKRKRKGLISFDFALKNG